MTSKQLLFLGLTVGLASSYWHKGEQKKDFPGTGHMQLKERCYCNVIIPSLT